MAKKKKRKKKKRKKKKTTTKASKKVAKKTKRKKTTRRIANRTMRASAPAAAESALVRLTVGTCLTLAEADAIVQDAIPDGPHDIDSTLEDAGLISDNQRRVFRDDVAQGVRNKGCAISRDEVPNAASNTLRDVRTVIKAKAGPA
jgi:hypothetical protein